MWELVSDGFYGSLVKQGLSVRNANGAISFMALVDLLVIVPAITVFLVFNIRSMISLGFTFLVVAFSLLLFLPVGIFYASLYLTKRKVLTGVQVSKNEVLPIVLFLILIFAMLGIFVHSMGQLSNLIPSFGYLNVPGFAVMVVNLAFVMKNYGRVLKS